ncbi:unnamed protein product [Strongylus vulgaris]|uniref:Leishmanolysin-like peptidase n=1 Tax=Strongylus vulgaris TaxID=40348 RepID=A0A3P7JBV4_STRVU|nr:unnamed protein product [Strongylus vulgaris]
MAKDDGCSSTTLAFAAHCSLEQTPRRPIAGFVNICPKQFNKIKAAEIHQWEATVKHELVHALVFSPTLFRHFQNKASAQSNEGDSMTIPGVIERFTRNDWECAGGIVS